MAERADFLALNDSITQLDRARAAPAPDKVKVDGRSLADLLAFAADYGVLINYYDLRDMPDGDWSAFFLGDPSIGHALHASLDLAGIQLTLDLLMAELRAAAEFEDRHDRLKPVVDLILRLIRVHMRGGTRQTELPRALAGLIGSDRSDLLAAPARRLSLHLGGDRLEHRVRDDRDDWFPQLLDYIEALTEALLTALEQDRGAALAALEASFDDHSHPPQSGLYDAFAKLFRHAQDSINGFPERLIRFYQRDILHQTSRAATPDKVTLTFTPAKDIASAELPRGTQFLAGADADGESIAYALDSALSVDAASLESLRTLTVTSMSVGPDALAIPALVLTGIVALADKAPRIAKPFPIFGAAAIGTDGVLTTTEAGLGFAVSSPTLMLTGGTRAVVLSITIAPDSVERLTETLETLAAAAGGIAPEDVFVDLIRAAFALRYSTAGGWVDILHYEVTPPAPDYPTFALSFLLDSDALPFVALSTTPPAADAAAPAEGEQIPDPDVPTLVAGLRQDPVALGADGAASVYPYSLLARMELSSLSIDVEVAGLADLQASTPTGPVDTGQPFLLFGSPPVQDATIEITAPELFAKRMDSFELEIDWFGLPVTSTGFQGYYKAYVIDADGRTVPPGSQFDNRSFTARLDVYNPGWWCSDSAQYLFRTDRDDPEPAADGALYPETLLIAPVEPSKPPSYYDPALSAVRLRLDQPDTGFGNILYAPNVAAASVRLTAAASACAQQCGQAGQAGPSDANLGPVIAANRTAPDSELDRALGAAVQGAVAGLDGAALEAINDAVAASEAEPETKAAWQESLSDALGEPKPARWFRRLIRWWRPAPDFATVHSNLSAWLAANEADLAPPDSIPIAKARAMLAAASDVLAVQAEAAGRPASVSRPVVAAGLRDVKARLETPEGDTNECIQKCMKGTDLLGFPNQPWLPMAAGITATYNASTRIPAQPDQTEVPATLFHLLPFGGIDQAAWAGGTVPLLYQPDSPGALFVGLSGAADELAVLLQLAPPKDGWPTDTPRPSWAQAVKDGWKLLPPLRDGTNDLRNSGIVSLPLADPDAAQPLLRLSVPCDAAAFPLLAGLATNAAMATWVGPGGGAGLGTPLPAGTITKSAAPMPAIGSIDQPMPSSGGAPADSGAAFEEWLAERLRHKDRGIQAWDYANLLLDAFPALWQAAIVPANGGGGGPAPGHVWVAAVPGPQAPDIADPRIPSSSAAALHDMAAFLGDRISPFIQLAVTNPPYLPIEVKADLLFTGSDSAQADIERLNAELIEYLSPWPPANLPPRPDDYYTIEAVAHFIRHRPYVRAILSLDLIPVWPSIPGGWHYLTSASAHDLRGKTQPGPEPPLPPILSLPAPGRAAAGGAA